jgi:molybdopterin converting factor small subunit
MKIDVELFGQLLPEAERRRTLTLKQEMSAEELAVSLGLSLEEVGMIVIDGVQSDFDTILLADCRVCFFPHMTGG